MTPSYNHNAKYRQASRGGHGIDEILEVTQLLEKADIPCCIVGVRALRYFGAGRIADEWDVCVPDDKLEAACFMFESAPLNAKFDCVPSPGIMPYSIRFMLPTFNLKGVNFYFVLAPSSNSLCDPRPEFCERSHNGVPYPKDVHFARCMIVRNISSDLADFVDAHNSTQEWGERNLNFPELQKLGEDYTVRKFKILDDHYGRSPTVVSQLDFKAKWTRVVERKNLRIEPLKQGRYITRWRSKLSPMDPRHNDQRYYV